MTKFTKNQKQLIDSLELVQQMQNKGCDNFEPIENIDTVTLVVAICKECGKECVVEQKPDFNKLNLIEEDVDGNIIKFIIPADIILTEHMNEDKKCKGSGQKVKRVIKVTKSIQIEEN